MISLRIPQTTLCGAFSVCTCIFSPFEERIHMCVRHIYDICIISSLSVNLRTVRVYHFRKTVSKGISSLAKVSSNVLKGLSWPEWPIDASHTAAIRVRFVPIRSESGHAVSQTQQFLRKFHLDSCCSLGSSEPHWAWVRMSSISVGMNESQFAVTKHPANKDANEDCSETQTDYLSPSSVTKSTRQFKLLLLQLGTI